MRNSKKKLKMLFYMKNIRDNKKIQYDMSRSLGSSFFILLLTLSVLIFYCKLWIFNLTFSQSQLICYIYICHNDISLWPHVLALLVSPKGAFKNDFQNKTRIQNLWQFQNFIRILSHFLCILGQYFNRLVGRGTL